MGLAVGLTMIPLFWLTAFGRHKRIAFQGDWTRAARRGAWVGLVDHASSSSCGSRARWSCRSPCS